jgi:hypothetical protein
VRLLARTQTRIATGTSVRRPSRLLPEWLGSARVMPSRGSARKLALERPGRPRRGPPASSAPRPGVVLREWRTQRGDTGGRCRRSLRGRRDRSTDPGWGGRSDPRCVGDPGSDSTIAAARAGSPCVGCRCRLHAKGTARRCEYRMATGVSSRMEGSSASVAARFHEGRSGVVDRAFSRPRAPAPRRLKLRRGERLRPARRRVDRTRGLGGQVPDLGLVNGDRFLPAAPGSARAATGRCRVSQEWLDSGRERSPPPDLRGRTRCAWDRRGEPFMRFR